MNIEELRIGNWVSFNIGGSHQIDIDDFIQERETGQSFFHLRPIPLTEEWLLRCEGVYKNGEWFTLHGFHENINISLVHNITTFGSNEEHAIENITTLHGLQNLYRALTGEELEINR